MKDPLMSDSGFSAKLPPDIDRIIDRSRNVLRYIGVLVAQLIAPTVLMFFADVLTRRIVMILAQIEAVNPARTPMDQHIGQGTSKRIVTASY